MLISEAELLRKRVLGWVCGMQVEKETCAYRMSSTGEPTLTSALMALFVRSLYGDLATMPSGERGKWIGFLTNMQEEETGLFWGYDVERTARDEKYDASYIAHMNTSMVVPALDLVGGKPNYPLSFLEDWLDPESIRCYLLSRDWSNPWYETDLIIYDSCSLAYDMEESEDPTRHRRAFEVMFDTLDAFQDPATGLWGTNHSADPYEAMAGTWHLFIIYNYLRRPVHYPEKIIDSTLALQGEDGHMFPAERRFGSCSDMDATDLLVNLYRGVDHRRDDIREALARLLEANLRLQNPDGGFRPSRSDPLTTVWVLSHEIKNPSPGESDVQATWFRSLVIALISQVFPDHPLASINWTFNRRLSVGWYRR